ncbi:MFS transporter [Actinoplanes sp. N902-109]|uniref:MFS transporter n=1 Tax=Actinoplanes sp. (strain N902-109) TaxID=649831 RepID=UPI0003293813|nr:MFS transporter [Actinoplanes sp. N902-109]AGL15978.1 major facilitator superfamily protein [Actinoplanes sp. N902-109]
MNDQTISKAELSRWRNAIIAAFALGGLALSTWGPRLPDLRAELELNTGGIGVLLAGVTVGSVGGLLASTPLLAALGARRAITGAILTIAAAVVVVGAGAGWVHSTVLTAAGFTIAGFAIGSLDVIINVEGAAIERAAGRTLMPLMHAAWPAGAALGSGIGAACAALQISPATQFTAEAVLMAAAAPLLGRALPPGRRADADATGEQTGNLRRWLHAWTDWRLLLIGLIMLGAELGEGSANNWLTLAAKDGHGQAAAVAALFFTVFAVGETAARVGGGPLVDRFGRAPMVRVTSALGVLGVALFILADHPALLLIGVLLWSVGVSMGFPLGMSAAAESGANPAARVAVVATIGYFANLAGPPALGFVAESTSLLTALWLVALFLGIASLIAGAVRPRR